MFVSNNGAPVPNSNTEMAYYLLADRVGQVFPEGVDSVKKMYEKVGRPLRLPKQDFKELVKKAVANNYLVDTKQKEEKEKN